MFKVDSAGIMKLLKWSRAGAHTHTFFYEFYILNIQNDYKMQTSEHPPLSHRWNATELT